MNLCEKLNGIVICLASGNLAEFPKANRVALERGLKISEPHKGSMDSILAELGGFAKILGEGRVSFDSKSLSKRLEEKYRVDADDCIYSVERVAEDPSDCCDEKSEIDEYVHGGRLAVRFVYDDGKGGEDEIMYAERLHDFVEHVAWRGEMFVTGAYYYKER